MFRHSNSEREPTQKWWCTLVLKYWKKWCASTKLGSGAFTNAHQTCLASNLMASALPRLLPMYGGRRRDKIGQVQTQVLHAGKLRRWLGGRKRESFQPQTRCLFPQCCCFQGLHLEQVKAHTQSDFQVLHVYAALPPLKSIQGETVTSEGAKYKSLQRDQRSVASKRIASPSVLVGCQKRKKTGDLRGREKKKRFTVD